VILASIMGRACTGCVKSGKQVLFSKSRGQTRTVLLLRSEVYHWRGEWSRHGSRCPRFGFRGLRGVILEDCAKGGGFALGAGKQLRIRFVPETMGFLACGGCAKLPSIGAGWREMVGRSSLRSTADLANTDRLSPRPTFVGGGLGGADLGLTTAHWIRDASFSL